MAKILVADDNSNVQKTVALALAGLGVEVASVNNGEAAVRKLSNFSPDLVLADIFMPVRNGYEVCEFIKKDARFSRVPVVLLVGAFDPLDEREAQRVGADGILKKPFVPPDPLIAMVKTLLDRTLGERLVTVSAPAPTTAVQAMSGGNGTAEAHAPAPELPEELPIQEFPSPAQRVAFGEGAHPVAFGTLLETPDHDVAAQDAIAIEPVDDEQILTSSRDATLGDPIFWKNDVEEKERETAIEPSEEPTQVTSPVPEIGAWKQQVESPVQHEEPPVLQPVEPIELVHEEQDETASNVVDPVSILQDPAAMATLNVESHKAEDLAANPLEWMASVPTAEEEPEAGPDWEVPMQAATDTIGTEESADHAVVSGPDLAAVSSPAPGVHLVQPPAQVSIPAPTPVLEQAEVPVKVNAALPENAELATSEPPAWAPKQTRVEVMSAKPSTEDTARSIPKKDWADLTASLQPSLIKDAVQALKSQPVPTATNSEAPLASNSQQPSPDAALVEAVVQRVLDKMRPQVVDIITKEFLRPIVQALVHREIDKH